VAGPLDDQEPAAARVHDGRKCHRRGAAVGNVECGLALDPRRWSAAMLDVPDQDVAVLLPGGQPAAVG
jgi:hypothetical protein